MGRANYIAVPRTKLVGDPLLGYSIYLECLCGYALLYPGHPDELDAVECPNCSQVFRACPPDSMKAALRGTAR